MEANRVYSTDDIAHIVRYNETKGFLNDMWNPKYGLGLYFSALIEQGDQLYIPLGLRRKGELKWYKALHALFDGFSALESLFKEENIRFNIQTPPTPGPRNRIKALLSTLNSKPVESHRYINQTPPIRGNNYKYASIQLRPMKERFSLTAVLGTIIAKNCMKHLTTNHTSRWMIPVRTHQGSGLNATYLGLNISTDHSYEQTHKQLVKKLKSGEHWGYYYLSRIGLLLGKHAIRYGTKKSLSKEKSLWLGTISNLGVLGNIDEVEELLIVPPVRWHRPIGSAIYQLNDVLYITFAVHESLSSVNMEKLANDIKQDALSLPTN